MSESYLGIDIHTKVCVFAEIDSEGRILNRGKFSNTLEEISEFAVTLSPKVHRICHLLFLHGNKLSVFDIASPNARQQMRRLCLSPSIRQIIDQCPQIVAGLEESIKEVDKQLRSIDQVPTSTRSHPITPATTIVPLSSSASSVPCRRSLSDCCRP